MATQKPNIILIVLDTHRADRLGCYGYTRDTSPNIDQFAKSATRFENAVSPAQWTIPSHASMFSGEYPTTHKTIQADDALSENFKTLAEQLKAQGYQTTGFCNNPLVGLLDNGFRRGFDQFYNYGGTIPSTPKRNSKKPRNLFHRIRSAYYRLIDRIATPIQKAVASSPAVFEIILNPWLVPIWTHLANFKGDTAASIRDTTQFVHHANQEKPAQPQFVFLNLMGTHLPYAPPKRFIHKFATIVLENRAAKDFINHYNSQAVKWLLPLEQPYPALECQTLSDMYDAEVAYQDFLLSQLLTLLDHPAHRENTMVIITSDHGEMLGEHQIMGHGIGVHQELVHVPLLVRFPGQIKPQTVPQAVSTTRVFHTILEATGQKTIATASGEVDLAHTSLRNLSAQPKYVFSEAYTASTLITTIRKHAPSLMEPFNCQSTRWAVYNQPYKLIRVENVDDSIYNYLQDPGEQETIQSEADHIVTLQHELDRFLADAAAAGQESPHTTAGNIADKNIMERLRSLGYID